MSVFAAACVEREEEIVEKMLEYDVDLSLKYGGKNVLGVIMERVNDENMGWMERIMEMLLEKEGGLVEGEGKMLLEAAEKGNVRLIMLILKYEVNVNGLN